MAKGIEIFHSLSSDSDEREQQLLAAIFNGDYVQDWGPLRLESYPYHAVAIVGDDALKVGEKGQYPSSDAVRVPMTARATQQVADYLGAAMITPKVLDEMYRQADFVLRPCPCGTSAMNSTQRFIEHNNCIENQLTQLGVGYGRGINTALIAPTGKQWVNTAKLDKTPVHPQTGAPAAVNYGWHTEFPTHYYAATIPNVHVWQPAAMAHDWNHIDYSQLARYMSRTMLVCMPRKQITGFGALATGPCDLAGQRGLGQLPTGPCDLAGYRGLGQVADEPCTMLDGEPGVWVSMDVEDVGRDPVLSGLISHEGPLTMRQPHPAQQPADYIEPAPEPAPGTVPSEQPSGPVPPPSELVARAQLSTTKKLAVAAAGVLIGYSVVQAWRVYS